MAVVLDAVSDPLKTGKGKEEKGWERAEGIEQMSCISSDSYQLGNYLN